MFKFVTEKIGIKVALIVNLVLLIVMAAGTFYLTIQQSASLEGRLLEKAKMLSIAGAASIQAILEEAVDNGALTVADVFDKEYVAIPGIEPAKFHTKYDSYLDKSLLRMQDEYLKDASVIYAVAADAQGYVPTHNTIYQKPLTGDKEKDKAGNRTKRVFNDPIGLKAAQTTQEGFLQVYKRDTGETMWDVSSPVTVKGKKWGAFRLGYSLERTQMEKSRLTTTLIGIMFLTLLLSIVFVFFFVNRALKPVGDLTLIASKMADGEVGQPIKSASNDEIGKLANVIERLRISLKTAMDRLQKR